MERFPIPEDHLLAELDWVRAIARQLVSDAGQVDDVVQETWLVAATRPPRAQSGLGLRRWLARVTRSIAVRLLRGERARLRRERDSARPEGLLATPPDILALATQQKQLMAAVLELEDPYRSAVLMRFVEELTPDQIAVRQGISSTNARQRVSRGLASVRRRLEREWTERERGQLPILGFYLPETAAEPAMAAPFALEWLAAAAAALVVLGAWWLRPDAAPADDPRTLSMTPPAETLADSAPMIAGSSGAAREPLGASATLEPAPAQREHRFRGRIVDMDGIPVPDSTLELPILPHVPAAHADESGRFELVVRDRIPIDLFASREAAADCRPADPVGGGIIAVRSEEWRVLLTARAPGHAPLEVWVNPVAADWREEPPTVLHALGDLVLARRGTIAGRLLGPDATPLADHPVRLVPFESGLTGRGDAILGVALAASDAGGSFHFEEVPEGLWRLFGGGPGLRWTGSPVFSVESATPTPLIEFVVERANPEELLRGRVFRPDGRPACRAPIVAAPVDDSPGDLIHLCADAKGEFELEVTPGIAYDLSAFMGSLDTGARETRTLRSVRAGTAPLEIWLRETRVLALVVLDHAGQPVPLYEVHQEGEEVLGSSAEVLEGSTGRALIELPDHACRLIVRAEGFQAHDLGRFGADKEPGARTVRLVPLARVRGQVRAGGRPVPAAAVEIALVLPDGEPERIDGFPARLDRTVYRRAETDARGEFELPILAPGRFALRAEAGDWAACEVGPLALDPRRDEHVDLELTKGGTVVGRVLAAPGEDPAGYTVRLANGDGHILPGVSDAAGRYVIDHLTPGRYMLSVRRDRHLPGADSPGQSRRNAPVPPEFPWTLEVREGETTVHDIDLATLECARLYGSLRVDGKPYGLASARYLPGEWHWSERFVQGEREHALARGGSFAFEELRPGPGWLVLDLPGALDGVVIVRRVELARGANEVSFELAGAEMRGRLPAGVAPLALLARLDGETFALARLADGAPLLEPRTFFAADEVWLVECGAELDPFAWRRLAALTLRTGECAVLE